MDFWPGRRAGCQLCAAECTAPCLVLGHHQSTGTGDSPDTPQGLRVPQGARPASVGMLCVSSGVSRAGRRDVPPPMYPPASFGMLCSVPQGREEGCVSHASPQLLAWDRPCGGQSQQRGCHNPGDPPSLSLQIYTSSCSSPALAARSSSAPPRLPGPPNPRPGEGRKEGKRISGRQPLEVIDALAGDAGALVPFVAAAAGALCGAPG